MGMARSQLYEMGDKAQKAANAVFAARNRLDGSADKAGADSGGFYPKGMNGALKST
jgi:hypothetical protein